MSRAISIRKNNNIFSIYKKAEDDPLLTWHRNRTLDKSNLSKQLVQSLLKILPLITDNEVSFNYQKSYDFIVSLNSWIEKNYSTIGSLLDKNWVEYPNSFVKDESNIEYTSNNGETFLISKMEEEPVDMKIISSAILLPSGKIPKLNLWIGKTINTYNWDPNNILPKDLVRYEFLIRALKKLAGYNFEFDLNPYQGAKLSDFINENKDKLNNLFTFFNKQPEYLGSGADGIAFKIGDGFVLKLFNTPHGHNEAIKAMERLHKSPDLAKTEANIYDAGMLGVFSSTPIYYYIIEYMIPVLNKLSDSAEDALIEILHYIKYIIENKNFLPKYSAFKKVIDNPKYSSLIKSTIEADVENILQNYFLNLTQDAINTQAYLAVSPVKSKRDVERDNIFSTVELREDWLKNLIEEIIFKYVTGRTDLHLGNLGVTSYGNFRYFDPAHEDWTSNLNL